MLMETSMRVSGKMIKPMVTEAILMLTVLRIMVNGKMINNTEKV